MKRWCTSVEFVKELKQHMVVCICNHTAQEAETWRVQKQHPGVQIKTLFQKMVVVRGALIVAVVIDRRKKEDERRKTNI